MIYKIPKHQYIESRHDFDGLLDKI